MYTLIDFKSKKALKEAVKDGKQVIVFQPNDMFGKTEECEKAEKMVVYLEGPHYPQPHKWYAQAETRFGIITKIIS